MRFFLLFLICCSLVFSAWDTKPGPDKVIETLKTGNLRFSQGKSIHPNTTADRLRKAGMENQGNHAIATVVTCSDSRVPVERVFDAGVMDVFVIRVAGNVSDTDEIGSIEYGLVHVNTPVLVILGHTQCGAVTAVTHAVEGHGHKLETNIPPLVDNIKPAVLKAKNMFSHLHGNALVPQAIKENVKQSIRDLFRRSPVSRDLVKQGKVKVVGAVYDVSTGKVDWMSESVSHQMLAEVEADPSKVQIREGHLNLNYQPKKVPVQEDMSYLKVDFSKKPTPREAVKKLQEGNQRFVLGKSIHPHTDLKRLTQAGLENQGDHAYATVITCSDSRVPVERVFDAGVMDLFIIRVAGNVCDTDEVGSIEYGIAHVKTPVLLILGHTQCGAVTAVTHALNGHGHALETNIPPLIEDIEPAVRKVKQYFSHLHGTELVEKAVEQNVWQSVEDLFVKSPAARKLAKSGQVKVIGAIYDVGTGQVQWLSEVKPMEILAEVESRVKKVSKPSVVSQVSIPVDIHKTHFEETHASAKQEDMHVSPRKSHAVLKHFKKVKIKPVKISLVDRSKLEIKEQRYKGAEISFDTSNIKAISLWWLVLCSVVAIGFFVYLLNTKSFVRASLKGKLYFGFGLVVALGVMTGFLGYQYMMKVADELHLEVMSSEIDMLSGEISTIQLDYVLTGMENPEKGKRLLDELEGCYEEMSDLFKRIEKSTDDDQVLNALPDLKKELNNVKKEYAQLVNLYKEAEEIKEKLERNGEESDHLLENLSHKHKEALEVLENQTNFDISKIKTHEHLLELFLEADIVLNRVGRLRADFMLDKHVELVDEIEKELGMLEGILHALEEILDSDQHLNDELRQVENLDKKLAVYIDNLKKILLDEVELVNERERCLAILHSLEQGSMKLGNYLQTVADEAEKEAAEVTAFLLVLLLIIGAILAGLISSLVTKPILSIIGDLNAASQEVNAAADGVAGASQNLASSVNQQAASLEESSASMEEIAAMSNQTAKNSGTARGLMGEAKDVVGEGAKAVDNMSDAMTEINDSSDKIGNIIKTIEEIAFQTNLLALNAAVEAARAGDAGKGFAVVAEEVRNLAQRASEAAQNTTTLIEGTVVRVKNGTGIVEQLKESFDRVEESAGKVYTVIDEISGAAEQQSQGISQVTMAMSEMEKQTQNNAANSEESASAAEELSGQADQMRSLVHDLRVLIFGE
jgi:carbonic anhydrase/methyl-accepting chemotaxis protein